VCRIFVYAATELRYQAIKRSALTIDSLTQTNSLRPSVRRRPRRSGRSQSVRSLLSLTDKLSTSSATGSDDALLAHACAVTTADDERWQKMASNLSWSGGDVVHSDGREYMWTRPISTTGLYTNAVCVWAPVNCFLWFSITSFLPKVRGFKMQKINL